MFYLSNKSLLRSKYMLLKNFYAKRTPDKQNHSYKSQGQPKGCPVLMRFLFGNISPRANRGTVYTNFKMKVIPCAGPGGANAADLLTAADGLTGGHANRGHMTVKGSDIAAVTDNHVLAVTGGKVFYRNNGAAFRCQNRCSGRCGNIYPGMELPCAGNRMDTVSKIRA